MAESKEISKSGQEHVGASAKPHLPPDTQMTSHESRRYFVNGKYLGDKPLISQNLSVTLQRFELSNIAAEGF
jgi:hypothetical protein